MRIVLLYIFAFLIAGNGLSQKKDEFRKEIRELFWGAQEKHKETTEIPEKWENESAVIIYQKILYQYKQKSPQSYTNAESIRRRIKLLDQSAIDEYSEFELSNLYDGKRSSRNWEHSLVEIKIIKPDGTTKEVDMSKAIDVDDKNRSSSKKIAIEDLEKGDILDYYYYTSDLNKFLLSTSLDPVFHYLASSYPIVEQSLQIEVDDKVYFNGATYNGAPPFEMKNSASEELKTYSISDKNREKRKDLRWNYPIREEAHLKFQIHLVPREKDAQKMDTWSIFSVKFLGKPGKIHNSFSTTYLTNVYKQLIEVDEMPRLIRTLEKKYGDLKDTRQILNDIYDEERYSRVMQFLEPIVLVREEIFEDITDDSSVRKFSSFPSSENMLLHMAEVCQTLKLDYEMLVVAPRATTSLEDLLIRDEIEYLVKVNLAEPVYFSNWYVFSEFDQIPRYLEGSEALSLKTNADGKITTGNKVVLPVSSHKKNKTEKVLSLDLTDVSAEQFQVKRSTKVSGLAKNYYQTNLLVQKDYLDLEYQYFDKERFIDRITLMSKKKANIIKQYDEYDQKEKKKQRETIISFLEDDASYTIKEYSDYEIVSNGRLDQKNLIYSEEYTIDSEFLKRAGKNYLIPIGSLVDGQVAIKEDEINRDNDVYMPFARSFDYNISVTIPEGFTVEGLDKLNVNVSNSTGGFKSNAELVGKEIKLTCSKWYTHLYEPVANWPQLVEFLNAAFQLSQEKILLKKA